MYGEVKISKGIPLTDKRTKETFFKRIRIASVVFPCPVFGEGRITYVHGKFTLHRRPRVTGLSLLPMERLRLEQQAKTTWVSEGKLTKEQTLRMLVGLYGEKRAKQIIGQLQFDL